MSLKAVNLQAISLLEHMVDVIFVFPWIKKQGFKKLLAEKNRFGATDIPGFFTMTKLG